VRAVMQPVSGTFELRRRRHRSDAVPEATRRPRREASPAEFDAAAFRSRLGAPDLPEGVEVGEREAVSLTR
jgi:hypothetical protein